ncbi:MULTISPECIES: DUF397 domain-containing protein [unclassified Streptomyces]|uniref:DUF397 domain-containing protein n=1 Tax=unclassified Streptomyces TaxID=2593676 RepID=UPI000F6CB50D|nr:MULTISPECIES: DUF397 domain-containing protein [unclassified Streptomyces]AZM62413.1 DUF397 domain-containing protein [Streptomyces sp. WAC 01438]RSM93561.1 DUF397 domain-containing protein [Streptomyces sp. WAC 01420]
MREYDLSEARWRRSTYSDGNGGNCVEVAHDFPGAARWRKSSYSGGSGGEECVEVADDLPGVVPVRDSKTGTAGPVIVVGSAAWTEFIRTVAMA